MTKIAPSLLAADFSDLKNEIADISSADYLHLDVMDGHFVPNLSIGPGIVKAIRGCTDMIFDVHLMITSPLKYIPAFAKAGADIITVHVECEDNTSEALSLIKSFGIKCGIVLSPDTPAEAALPFINDVDLILVMSVYPGFGGQKFIEASLEKLSKLRSYRQTRRFEIEIDGGIGADNAAAAAAAGADVLVAGTSIFKASDRKAAISGLR